MPSGGGELRVEDPEEDLVEALADIAGLQVAIARLETDRPAGWEDVRDEMLEDSGQLALTVGVRPVADRDGHVYVCWRRRPLWWLGAEWDFGFDGEGPGWTVLDEAGELGRVGGLWEALEAMAWLDARLAEADSREEAGRLRRRAVELGARYDVRYWMTGAGDRLLTLYGRPVAALGWDPRAQTAVRRGWRDGEEMPVKRLRRQAEDIAEHIACGLDPDRWAA